MGKVIVCKLNVSLSDKDWASVFCELAVQSRSGVLLLPSYVDYVTTTESDSVELRKEEA